MSKDNRFNIERRQELVEDDRWKFKGGPLGTKKHDEPQICPQCQGLDPECPLCEGEGVIYD
jgi:hypothetical protein